MPRGGKKIKHTSKPVNQNFLQTIKQKLFIFVKNCRLLNLEWANIISFLRNIIINSISCLKSFCIYCSRSTTYNGGNFKVGGQIQFNLKMLKFGCHPYVFYVKEKKKAVPTVVLFTILAWTFNFVNKMHQLKFQIEHYYWLTCCN